MGKGCKVVVCGMASVGKTAILEQLLYGTHIVGMSASLKVPWEGEQTNLFTLNTVVLNSCTDMTAQGLFTLICE